MISEIWPKKYCKEDISLIENYEKAITDTTQTWVCHHRDEVKVLPSGMTVIRSRQDLIDNERYYNCPANELIFLTKSEHDRLHYKGNTYHKGMQHTENTCKKISKALKGKTKTEFGVAFKEHYGITCRVNHNLYKREYSFYKYHGHFSWEV